MADPELPGDDTRPDAGRRHLDDLEPDVVGQRSAVDEHSAELVHPTLAWNKSVLSVRYVSYRVDHLFGTPSVTSTSINIL